MYMYIQVKNTGGEVGGMWMRQMSRWDTGQVGWDPSKVDGMQVRWVGGGKGGVGGVQERRERHWGGGWEVGEADGR